MKIRLASPWSLSLGLIAVSTAIAPGMRATAFTYQGQLKKSGSPVTSTCNFEFGLYTDSGGTTAAPNVAVNPITVPGVAVSAGLFTAQLDFGANAFPGDPRWIRTFVQCTGDGSYTELDPAEPLSPAPIAQSLPGLATFQSVSSTSYGALLKSTGFGFTQTDGTIFTGSYVGSGGGWIGNRSNHPLYFFTNNSSPQMALTTSGALGIGTQSPTAPVDLFAGATGYGFLHRYGTIAVGSWAGSGAGGEVGGWYGTKSNHDLYLFTNNGGAQVTLERGTGNVGIGTISPASKLDVRGQVTIGDFNSPDPNPGLLVYGSIQLRDVPNITTDHLNLCYDYLNNHNIGYCTSSIRYKEHVADLTLGLDAVKALRPVSFDWKASGRPDLGFIAEEVDGVTPLLTFRDDKDQIQGVKYDLITTILVRGMQEQQARIEALERRNEELEAAVREIRKAAGQNGR